MVGEMKNLIYECTVITLHMCLPSFHSMKRSKNVSTDEAGSGCGEDGTGLPPCDVLLQHLLFTAGPIPRSHDGSSGKRAWNQVAAHEPWRARVPDKNKKLLFHVKPLRCIPASHVQAVGSGASTRDSLYRLPSSVFTWISSENDLKASAYYVFVLIS